MTAIGASDLDISGMEMLVLLKALLGSKGATIALILTTPTPKVPYWDKTILTFRYHVKGQATMDGQHSGYVTSGNNIDIEADARTVFDVLRRGGLAIIPSDVGYGLVALDEAALNRAFL